MLKKRSEVLRRRTARASASACLTGRGPGLPAAWPAGYRTLRRRGSADQACHRTATDTAQQHTISSMNPRPDCIQPTSRNSLRNSMSWSNQAIRHRDGARHARRSGSDWIIDIGPGAGDDGGRLVAAGTPAEISKTSESRTASYLAHFLD